MISIVLNPKEKFSHLVSGPTSRFLILMLFLGLFLISEYVFGESVTNEFFSLIGGIILTVIATLRLAISTHKVRKLQKILSDATLTMASKGDSTRTGFSISNNQVHEVAYHYEVDEQRYQVFLTTSRHGSCKPEELVVYSNSNHSESILLRKLSDQLVSKIKN